MKKVYLLISSLFISSALLAQEVKNVGIGTSAPDKSAVLDIQSSDKGLLIPRLTEQQINAIAKPAKGLLVFQTDESKSGFFFFNGEKWSPLTNGDVNSIATMDVNGWALDGNAVSSVSKAAANGNSFIGTPSNTPINFKIGGFKAGEIGIQNTFLGNRVGINATGLNNVGIGSYSMGYTSAGVSGGANVGIGANSMSNTTSGSSNMALGTNTLRYNTIGNNNLSIGTNALYSNTVGNFNTAIGSQGLYTNIAGSNNVSIGTNSGFSSVGSGNVFLGFSAGYNEVGSNKLYIANSNTANPLIKGEFDNKTLRINTGATTSSSVGFLAIGNFDAAFPMPTGNTYRLVVQDGIITEKVKVALKSSASDWADYVFEPEYKANMLSLEEVEAFTLKNKHLPNVPSAKEMVEKGLDVGETSKMFMEKIEELTLYVIELNKEVKALKAENAKLKK